MEMEEIYQVRIIWTDKCKLLWEDAKRRHQRSFIILWSNHTWDEFEYKSGMPPWEDKKHFDLSKIKFKRMDKNTAIQYIRMKIEEIEQM